MRRSVDRQRMSECTSDKDRPDKDLYASVCICSHYVFRLSVLLCARVYARADAFSNRLAAHF